MSLCERVVLPRAEPGLRPRQSCPIEWGRTIPLVRQASLPRWSAAGQRMPTRSRRLLQPPGTAPHGQSVNWMRECEKTFDEDEMRKSLEDEELSGGQLEESSRDRQERDEICVELTELRAQIRELQQAAVEADRSPEAVLDSQDFFKDKKNDLSQMQNLMKQVTTWRKGFEIWIENKLIFRAPPLLSLFILFLLPLPLLPCPFSWNACRSSPPPSSSFSFPLPLPLPLSLSVPFSFPFPSQSSPLPVAASSSHSPLLPLLLRSLLYSSPSVPSSYPSHIPVATTELARVSAFKVDYLKAVIFKQREMIRHLQAAITSEGVAAMTASDRPSLDFMASLSASLEEPHLSRMNSKGDRGTISDRRRLGGFDARFHSTSAGATPQDFRVLPARIILVRHGESYEDDSQLEYSKIPDPRIPLTDNGRDQANQAGLKIRQELNKIYKGKPYRVFFYTSPYLRSSQTFECLREAMFNGELAPGESPPVFVGMREEVQMREQDFGNFQDPVMKTKKRNERKRYGRFFYRFPNGESGADLYDRITIFQDHLIRDINAGRFSQDTNLVLVTHGLPLRVFLMRWFHWNVDQLLCVQNPPKAEPLVLERVPSDEDARPDGPVAWMHTKSLYRLSPSSQELLDGCTDEMCSASSPLFLTPPPQGPS